MECIICEDSRTTAKALGKAATAAGWTPRIAEDAEHALSMLKTKRWGAAIIEEGGVPGEQSGAQIISSFREWEASHRTVKQNNLFSLSNAPTNGSSYPLGFNGTIFRPIKEADVISLLQKASARRSDREEIQS
jgi:ActR/RegA family two-component response regulator